LPRKKPAEGAGAPTEGPRAPRSVAELRDLRDPKVMRALAHPIRLELLEALGLEGPLTATQAGEIIGETPTTCSFHLRQLQKYGFVEDCGTPGARERPWRIKQFGHNVPDWTGEPAVDIAAGALTKVVLERTLSRLRRWWDEHVSYPPVWRDAAGLSQTILFVTPSELKELLSELEPFLFRYVERMEDPSKRPPGSMPVELILAAFPMRAPEEG
jgi:DNA-binding transcriptional ArsR family regulator